MVLGHILGPVRRNLTATVAISTQPVLTVAIATFTHFFQCDWSFSGQFLHEMWIDSLFNKSLICRTIFCSSCFTTVLPLWWAFFQRCPEGICVRFSVVMVCYFRKHSSSLVVESLQTLPVVVFYLIWCITTSRLLSNWNPIESTSARNWGNPHHNNVWTAHTEREINKLTI